MSNPFLDYTKRSRAGEISRFYQQRSSYIFLIRQKCCRFPGKFPEKKAMSQSIALIVPYVLTATQGKPHVFVQKIQHISTCMHLNDE